MMVFPNAKINIGLHVLSARNDGYHNIETIFYPISIYDALEVVEAEKFVFSCSGLHIPSSSNENLCSKAYQLLRENEGAPLVHMHLHKNIPIGAGLGGGSADAAFVIRLIDEKFRLQLSEGKKIHYTQQLGADCLFFLCNTPVYAHGRGDVLERIELDLSTYFLVVINPPISVSTSYAYKNIKPAPTKIALSSLAQLPLEEWKYYVKNDFEEIIFQKYPLLKDIKAYLYASGALYASMSGSGSSLYGIFQQETKLPALEQSNRVFYGCAQLI